MSDPRLDTFDADIKAIAARFDTLRLERDEARRLACQLTEEVIEMRGIFDRNKHPFVGFTAEYMNMECEGCDNRGTLTCEKCREDMQNTLRPTDDTVRLEQVAAILNRYLGEYRADEVPPASLLRALAIAERSDA